MTTINPPDDRGADGWHGLPRTMSRPEATQIHDWLRDRLTDQARVIGRPIGPAALTAWFDPLARGARLRTALDQLAPSSTPPGALNRPFVLPAGEDRFLVTAEGSALADLIASELDSASTLVRLRWADTDAADTQVAAWYRDLATARLESVISLRIGQAPPLLPQAVGLVLLLLLNGNVGADRGLSRPASPDDLAVVDEAVARMVSRFADTLVEPSRERTAGAYSLYSGYAISEARRRLGSDLLTSPVALTDGSRERVVARIAEELARRPSLTWPDVEQAFQVLSHEYEAQRHRLAAYGLAQASPSEAIMLREALRATFNRARSDEHTPRGAREQRRA